MNNQLPSYYYQRGMKAMIPYEKRTHPCQFWNTVYFNPTKALSRDFETFLKIHHIQYD